MSSSGQYVTWITGINPAHLFLSNSYGLSYTASYWISYYGSGKFVAIDMSNSGRFQFIVTNNGSFAFFNLSSTRQYDSTQKAPVPFPAKWSAVTCSGDGSRVYAAVSSSLTVGGPLVFYSTNYSLFKINSIGANAVWTAAVNSGSYFVFCFPCILSCVIGLIPTTHSAAYRNWIFMKCSDSGQFVAGIDVRNVFVSSDYGVSYALTLTSTLGVNLTSITMDTRGDWFCLSVFNYWNHVITHALFQANTCPFPPSAAVFWCLRSTEPSAAGPRAALLCWTPPRTCRSDTDRWCLTTQETC
jgi:hypothetical protein